MNIFAIIIYTGRCPRIKLYQYVLRYNCYKIHINIFVKYSLALEIARFLSVKRKRMDCIVQFAARINNTFNEPRNDKERNSNSDQFNYQPIQRNILPLLFYYSSNLIQRGTPRTKTFHLNDITANN